MTLIYQVDQTKLLEIEEGIQHQTGLTFLGEKVSISTKMPILTSGTFYVELVFANDDITLEVTVYERVIIKQNLLEGERAHVHSQNFDHQYRYEFKLITQTQTSGRITIDMPEEYSGLKLDNSSFDTKVQKFRFVSQWMETPATDWGVINLCAALLVQIPGYISPERTEEKTVEISQTKELAAVS